MTRLAAGKYCQHIPQQLIENWYLVNSETTVISSLVFKAWKYFLKRSHVLHRSLKPGRLTSTDVFEVLQLSATDYFQYKRWRGHLSVEIRTFSLIITSLLIEQCFYDLLTSKNLCSLLPHCTLYPTEPRLLNSFKFVDICFMASERTWGYVQLSQRGSLCILCSGNLDRFFDCGTIVSLSGHTSPQISRGVQKQSTSNNSCPDLLSS